MLKLKTEARTSGQKRQDGFIPAVVYGPKMEAVSITIPEKDFLKLWKSAGESTVITLEGADGAHDVLIHDIARNPVSDAVIHVDFYAVDKNKKVHINIPLEFVGVAPGAKEFGGILMKIVHEVAIEALPKDLPHALEADLGLLVAMDSQIKASDIKLPSGVTLATDPEEIIAILAVAKEETEEDTGPVDISSIELSEKKGKKEEDAE